MRRGRVAAGVTAAVLLALAAPTWAGHESPFYPSYYPQQIRLDTVAPAAAARLLENASIHAYIGADPFAGRTPPRTVAPVESLGSYVVVTLNSSSGRISSPAARCAVAGDVIRSLGREPGVFVFHPYPVTPYHRDYLEHADLAASALQGYASRGGQAPGRSVAVAAAGNMAARLVGAHAARGSTWDARVETVDVDDLLARSEIRFAGWVGPPWLKEGWFDAYRLMAGSVADGPHRAEIDQAYHRLVTGDAHGVEERANLERSLVSLLRQGCERLVVGYTIRREFYNTEYSPGIENVGFDSHTGLNSAVFVRTAKLKDFPWNGWLRLGVASAPASPWNPVSGFGDAFGRLLWAAMGDPAMLPGPYNGSWAANRLGSWETWSERLRRTLGGVIGPDGLPRQELDVPGDAVLPRPGTGVPERVKPGTRAADMVEYRVLASSFHDGTAMTVADVVYPFILAYRWGGGNPHDPHGYDPSVGRATALMRRTLVGIKVVGTQKVVRDLGADLQLKYNVPVIRVYVNYPGGDPQHVAEMAIPWSTVPWPVLVLMEEAAKRGLGALSSEAAAAQRVETLDLVRSPRQKERFARLVDEFATHAYLPDALRGWASPDDARRRWRALQAFYRTNGHFLVTNGPYRLAKWSSAGVVLEAFRDLSYPLGVGSFDKEVRPRRAHLPPIQTRGGRVEFRPDVDRVVKYDRFDKIVREALGSNTSGAIDDVIPVCRYVIVRDDGRVIKVETAPDPKNGAYTISLGDRLGPGAYTAFVAVYLNENYMTPEVRAVAFRK
jgi:hypothetical protein